MFPPIFLIATSSLAVRAALWWPDAPPLLGGPHLRFYLAGDVPEQVPRPYAVWQQIAGNPENYISNTPDADSYSVQVDVYALTSSGVRSAARALRDAIEPHAHIVAWRGESRDNETRLYRLSFDTDWHVSR